MAQNADEAAIRRDYIRICKKLTPSDIGKIKFLFADKLNVTELCLARSAIDIFKLVKDRKLLTLDLLLEVLQLLNRVDLASRVSSNRPTSMSPSSARSSTLAPLVRSRRLHLFRLMQEKKLSEQQLSDLVYYNNLHADLSKREWPEVVEELLHTKLLDENADEGTVQNWIHKHVDDALAESPDSDELGKLPIGMVSVVDDPDQVDSVEETADVAMIGSRCSGILSVDRRVMEASYSSNQPIGEGRSAVVYRGSCPQRWLGKYGDLPIAVKVLKAAALEECTNGQCQDYFSQELLAAHVLRSPYVLPLLSYTPRPSSPAPDSTQQNPYCALMFPFMSGGDLYHRLFGKEFESADKALSWRSRVQIAYQMAAGLQTMHTGVPGRRQPIVHQDMKSANILLDELSNARIADTGLSREIRLEKSGSSSAGGYGTRGYCHPGASDGPYYMHYDWFSLGIVLFELLLHKPAAISKKEVTLCWRLVNNWHSLHYAKHMDINAVQPQDVRDMYAACWKCGKDSYEAADRLLYVALHCVAASPGALDDNHRKEWLGYNCTHDHERTDKGCPSSESCWTELTPVPLLRELCNSNRIPLHNTRDPGSPEAGRTVSGRCAACFALAPRGDDGLHTMSAACRPGECSWYCSDCMQSGEPVLCLKHGTAQPIIGGKNAHVIAVSGSGDGAEIFERGCRRLQEALTDYRFAGLSRGNFSAITAPTKNEVQLKLLSLNLQLEKKVIEHACSQALDSLHPQIPCRQVLHEAVTKVCTSTRKRVALKRCCSNYSNSAFMVPELSDTQRNRLLSRLVDVAWKRTDYLTEDLEQRAAELLAMFHLWSVDSGEATVPQMDTVNRVRTNETAELEKLAKQYRIEPAKASRVLAHLADVCFRELIVSCCLPVSPEAVPPDELQRCVIGLTQCVGEDMLQTTGKFIVDSLRPLADGLIWYHYCGHATGSGGDSLNETVLPQALLEAAGRLVANLIVTLDCCHADANVPKISFFVDEKAPYTGYSVLASCSAKQESTYSKSAAFTEFLVCGLRSATDDCRLAFERCFLGKTCDNSECRACQAYRKRDEQCEICTEYRTVESGCRQLEDVFNYIKHHVCPRLMSPVRHSSGFSRHIPVAYAHSKPPTYNVHLRLAMADQSPEIRGCTVEITEPIVTLQQIRFRMLREALRMIKSDSSLSEKSLVFPLACKLVACDNLNHTSASCVDEALRLIEEFCDEKEPWVSYETRYCHRPPTLHSQYGNATSENLQSDGIATTASFDYIAARISKMSSHISLSTVVGDIVSDSALHMSFRRGFDIHCVIDV